MNTVQNHSIKLTVIIPCYNEEKTIKECVGRLIGIAEKKLSLEAIIVDDGSGDKSLSIAKELEKEHAGITVLSHNRNHGKGASLRTGLRKATGDFVAIQDADLECDPVEIKNLIIPLIENKADVVLGSRMLTNPVDRFISLRHYWGNRFLTFLSNLFTGLCLTDMMTCYKVFKRKAIQDIDIREDRFGIEPEIIAKIAARGLRIMEIGISYNARAYKEGKKIRFKDGIRAVYCIFRYNILKLPSRS